MVMVSKRQSVRDSHLFLVPKRKLRYGSIIEE